MSGSWLLLRLALRRDRLLLPLLVLLLAGSAAGSAAATRDLYPDLGSRSAGAALINATPALVALYGRVWDPASLGALSLIKVSGIGTLMVGVLTLTLVVRHTRADEEAGRRELLAGSAVGVLAPLAAATAAAALAAVAVGGAAAVGLRAVGLPAAGSVAFGLGWTGVGLAFAGVGAATAQLAGTARAARGLGLAVLAAAYALRAAGDLAAGSEPGWESWWSPIGWAQQIRPFAGDRWLVALLAPVAALGLVAAAAWWQGGRDLGTGRVGRLVRPRRSGRGPRGATALGWRLQRTSLLGWSAVFLPLSLVSGQVMTSLGDMLQTPAARRLVTTLGGVDRVADAFLGVELDFVAVAVAAYGISVVTRTAGEEAVGRTELLLATALPRARYLAAQLLVAGVSTAALVLGCGLAVGLAHRRVADDPRVLGDDLLAAAVRLPAVWVLTASAGALYGWSRRAAAAGWGVLVASVLVSDVGPLLDLPGWLRAASPLSHIPALPGGALALAPLLALGAVAVGLGLVGLLGYVRRDIPAS